MAMDIPLHSYRLVQEYPIQLIKLQFNPYQEATLGEMDRGKKKKTVEEPTSELFDHWPPKRGWPLNRGSTFLK